MKKIQENSEHQLKMQKRNIKIQKFIQAIACQNYVALRLGKLQYQGIMKGRPKIQQKQVDMLIGLDISHVSYNKLVDRILLFCKDTDIVPALKCARSNGIQVSIADLENGIYLSDKLKKHSDVVRRKTKDKINSLLIPSILPD